VSASVDVLAGLDTAEQAVVVDSWLSGIRAALDDCDQVADLIVDRDTLTTILYDLRDIRSRVAEVFARYEKRVVNEAGEKSYLTPFGKVEIRRKTGWKQTRHDELLPVLVRVANTERRMNGETGEVESEGHAVARVIRECVSLGQVKVTGLRARDLAPDEFATPNDDGWTVQLPPRSL